MTVVVSCSPIPEYSTYFFLHLKDFPWCLLSFTLKLHWNRRPVIMIPPQQCPFHWRHLVLLTCVFTHGDTACAMHLSLSILTQDTNKTGRRSLRLCTPPPPAVHNCTKATKFRCAVSYTPCVCVTRLMLTLLSAAFLRAFPRINFILRHFPAI